MSNVLPLPYTIDDPEVQGNFDALAIALGGDLSGKVTAAGGAAVKIAFGADSMTGTGGSAIQTETITHGLGKTPTVVFVGSDSSAFNGAAGAVNATNFQAKLRHIDGTNWNTTETYYWLAIG